MTTKTVEESVERAIAGGATVVQLREKTLSASLLYHGKKREVKPWENEETTR